MLYDQFPWTFQINLLVALVFAMAMATIRALLVVVVVQVATHMIQNGEPNFSDRV